MAHAGKLRVLAATAVSAALSLTLLGGEAPAVSGDGLRADPTRVALPAAEAGDPGRPSWPDGTFGEAPAQGAAAGPGAEPGARPAGPADGAALADARPELSATGGADTAAYEFLIATGADPRTGQVTSSGWQASPRWKVPAGLLKDGGRYTWTVRAKSRTGRVAADAPARSFAVNQRLGAPAAGAAVPADSLGPVTVSLATGNVTASVATPQVGTGFGPLGATFTYNSQAVQTSAGLTGSYFAGDSGSGIAAGEKPAAVRTDARVDFAWGAGAPYPDADPAAVFRARWTGTIKVPEDGRYRLGGTYDGGLRVLVDGAVVLDDWNRAAATGDRAVYGREIALKAGQSHRITVEYRRRAAGGGAALWVSGAGRTAPVPASWLRPAGEVLPPGWTVTPAAAPAPAPAPAAGAAANGTPNGAANTAPNTAPNGAARQPDPLTAAAGSLTAATTGRPDLAPVAPRTPAGDRAHPGATHRKTAVRAAAGAAAADAQRPRTEGTAAAIAAAEEDGLAFLYAGSQECEGSGAPTGYVCAVRVPGAGVTRLVYRSGKLTRFVNPGGETTDLGFTADHLLTTVRPPLVTDWVAVDPARRDQEASRYRIDYRPGTAEAQRLTGPDPAGTPGRPDARPQRTYAFTPGTTRLQIAGVSTPQGWTREVTLDPAGRVLSDTDGTGRTRRFTWTSADQQASVTDPAGRLTTTVSDEYGRPAGSYGPGPQQCFGPDLRPVSPAPTGCAGVPAQTTSYGPADITTERQDSQGVPNQTVQTQLNEFGLPVATVADPAGLALKTGFRFDEFFRPVAKVQPNGVTQGFGYYGATESADNPCTQENDPAPQRGLPKSVELPKSATGTARTEKYVYNSRGLPAAVTFGGPDWTCIQYDDRGRITRMSMPGNSSLDAWTVDYHSAYGGDPLTLKAVQHDHFLLNTVDLLGRAVHFTDAQGVGTDTVYDRAGRAEQERVTPPSKADAVQVKRTAHDAAGRILSVALDGRQLAAAEYDTAGQVQRVRYANGTRLSVDRDEAGRITAKNWTLADGTSVPTAVTRSRSGTVVDESVDGRDGLPGAPDFRYDATGRLVTAFIGGHEYGRDFTAKAPADCPAGSSPDAGRNGNVTGTTDRTAAATKVTGYCYDEADRLLATTGQDTFRDGTYALNGHLTGYTGDGRKMTQRQDAVERYLGSAVTGPGAADVTYTKDIADHLMARRATSASGAQQYLYGHTDMANPDADLVLGTDKRVQARVIGLPGGVILSAKGAANPTGRTTWSLPTVRGDIFLVASDEGRQAGSRYQYGLTGEPLAPDGTVDPQRVPDNLPGDYDYGWLGRYQVATEHQGALYSVVLDTRVFNPAIGRFSAPVAAGPFLNPYEYAAGDPVNHTSTDGYSLDVEKE
ncbi:PA14 domain-containing protein [Streptomyces sp. NBC_00536]|uniref:PA14 domain-containing protein n=1 Tax=Streptomyces sp. NBC_00536 TaxID=2975769 RepID=UPI002E819E0B|nr:PA14 domain-containing protein [Streptomyces sp. NBC_00536]WUC79121.1 PA14 domain-containing protein [Streptomyces sp. NBC_00536]